jgi:hypothetical protein
MGSIVLEAIKAFWFPAKLSYLFSISASSLQHLLLKRVAGWLPVASFKNLKQYRKSFPFIQLSCGAMHKKNAPFNSCLDYIIPFEF